MDKKSTALHAGCSIFMCGWFPSDPPSPPPHYWKTWLAPHCLKRRTGSHQTPDGSAGDCSIPFGIFWCASAWANWCPNEDIVGCEEPYRSCTHGHAHGSSFQPFSRLFPGPEHSQQLVPPLLAKQKPLNQKPTGEKPTIQKQVIDRGNCPPHANSLWWNILHMCGWGCCSVMLRESFHLLQGKLQHAFVWALRCQTSVRFWTQHMNVCPLPTWLQILHDNLCPTVHPIVPFLTLRLLYSTQR